MLRVILFLLLSVLSVAAWSGAAEARRLHVYASPVEIDAWGRCIVRRGHTWWLTRCPGRIGIWPDGPYAW